MPTAAPIAVEAGSAVAPRPLRLGVLDQSPVAEGGSGAQALRNSVDLAQLAESVGYGRYWVAEHHGTPGLACASPEVLLGAIGAATDTIRIGSGGIMLPHYSPLKVAENFSMLGGLFGDRVDLGIGRAAGTDRTTSLALQRDRRQQAPDDFPQQLAELLAYLADDLPADHPFARLGRLPGRPGTATPWLLGSSPQSAVWAAELGLGYVFADFINSGGAAVARRYRAEFQPSQWQPEPRSVVAVWAICAETHAEAERLASSSRMMMSLLHRGRLIAVPSPETALAFLADEASRNDPAGVGPPVAGQRQRRMILGTPDAVKAGIESVAAEYAADEVLLVNILHDHAARRRSYELVAEAFSLAAVGAACKTA